MNKDGDKHIEGSSLLSDTNLTVDTPVLAEEVDSSILINISQEARLRTIQADPRVIEFINSGLIVNSSDSFIRELMQGVKPVSSDQAIQSIERIESAIRSSESINQEQINTRDENLLLELIDFMPNSPVDYAKLKKIVKKLNNEVNAFRADIDTGNQSRKERAKSIFAGKIIEILSPINILTMDEANILLDKMLGPKFDLNIKSKIKKQYPHFKDISDSIAEILKNADIPSAPSSLLSFTKIACLKLNQLYEEFISKVKELFDNPTFSEEDIYEKVAVLKKHLYTDKLTIVHLANIFLGEENMSNIDVQNQICAAFFTHTSDNSFKDTVNGWSLGAKGSDISRVIDIHTNESWWEYYKEAVKSLVNIYRLEKRVVEGKEVIYQRTDDECLAEINKIFKRTTQIIIPSKFEHLNLSYEAAKQLAGENKELQKLLNAEDIGQYLLDKLVNLSYPDLSKESKGDNSFKYRAESLILLRTLVESIYNKTLIQGQYSVNKTEKVRQNLVGRFKELNESENQCVYLGENEKGSHYFCFNIELEVDGKTCVYPIIYELVVPKTEKSMERKNILRGTPVGDVTDTLRASIYLPIELNSALNPNEPNKKHRKQELINACIKVESFIMKKIVGSDSPRHAKEAKWSFESGSTSEFSNGQFAAYKDVAKVNAVVEGESREIVPLEQAYLFGRPDDHEIYDYNQYKAIQIKLSLTGSDRFAADILRYASEILTKIEVNGNSKVDLARMELCVDNLLDFFRYNHGLNSRNKTDRSKKTRQFILENAKDALLNIFALLSNCKYDSLIRKLIDSSKLQELEKFVLSYLQLDKKIRKISSASKTAAENTLDALSPNSSFLPFTPVDEAARAARQKSPARQTGSTNLTLSNTVDTATVVRTDANTEDKKG